MGRRGRPRKQIITYDSDETQVVLGILSILGAILFFISLFESETQVFQIIRQIFGEVTFFVGLFLFNLGLFFIKKEWAMSSKISLIGQAFFIIALSVFLNSLIKQWDAYNISNEGKSGGLFGFFIRDQLEPIIGSDAIKILTVIIIVISIPISFSMSLDEAFSLLEKLIKKLFSWLKGAIPEPIPVEEYEDKIEGEKKAEMFSDFRQQQKDVHKTQEDEQQKHGRDTSEDKHSEMPKVEVKEVSAGEGAFVNEELQFPNWKLPPVDLLNPYKKFKPSQEDIKRNADIIEQTLRSFGIKAKVVDVLIGPTVSQYALDIALGTKVSKIQNLSTDLALALAVASNSIRIEAPIPGTSYVGVEIPNSQRQFINIREIIESKEFQTSEDALPVVVGKDLHGDNILTNLQKMPHLLVAGATGSGKSILTNGFIVSLLMKKTPDEVRMIMVDPKQVELSDYNGIPHLLTPVITDMSKVLNSLKWAIVEMENRYTMFKESKVRNIEGYNKMMGFSALPYIIIVIDEMADMMMSGGAEVEGAIVRLAQKARATGIHLLLATQRPSVDVITGLIKANIPGRIGMSVATQIDSRVILDQIGAEALLGKGDMLFKEPDKNKPIRVQGVWVSPEEIQRVVQFIKEQVPEVHYTKEVVEGISDPNLSESAKESLSFSDDDLFADAVRVVVQSGKGSSSLLQRKLSIGYNRAARLLDELQKYGVVGAQKGSKPRDVLIDDAESFLNPPKDEDDV